MTPIGHFYDLYELPLDSMMHINYVFAANPNRYFEDDKCNSNKIRQIVNSYTRLSRIF